MPKVDLGAGIYESLVTAGLEERVAGLPEGLEPQFEAPDAGEAHGYFARHAADSLRELMRPVEETDSERWPKAVIRGTRPLRYSDGHKPRMLE